MFYLSAIPLGIPDAFESELFSGKIIVQIRDVPSENPDGDPKEYPGSIGGKNNLAFEPVFVVAFIRVKPPGFDSVSKSTHAGKVPL